MVWFQYLVYSVSNINYLFLYLKGGEVEREFLGSHWTCKIITDPKGSSLYNYIKNGELKSEGNSITEGIGSSRLTKNFQKAIIDDSYSINDNEALTVLFELLEKEGLSLGTSSGINVAGAIKLAKDLGPNHNVVTILCDTSEKYRSKLFNKKFLMDKSLPYPNWL